MDDPAKPSLLKRIDNFVRGLANGMTFGAADTIAAVADTVVERATSRRDEPIGTTVAKNVAAEQSKTVQARKEGDELDAGEAYGGFALGAGVYRLLGGFAAIARYSKLVAVSGRLPAKPGVVRAINKASSLSTGMLRDPQTLGIAIGTGVVSKKMAETLRNTKESSEADGVARNAMIDRELKARAIRRDPQSP